MLSVDKAIIAHLDEAKSSQKKRREDDKKASVHFKLRVLDLIEIFIKKQSTNTLVTQVAVPLLHAVRNAAKSEADKPLFQRVKSIINNRLVFLRVVF